VDELVVRVGPEDLAGLSTLIEEDGSGSDAEAMVLQLFREGLATRLQSANDLDPDVVATDDAPDTLEAQDAGEKSGVARLMANDRARRSTFVVVALGVTAVLLGGYGKKWSWTGFSGNSQLWDWMHLLLLPIAIATFPLWLMYADHMSRVRRTILGLVVVAFAAFVVVGYLAPLDWTGFQGNTLWDWLTLILLPLAIVTARSWPNSKRELRAIHIVAIGALLLGWLVTLVGGYADSWSWTGYPGNTLWDWMTLLLGPIAFTTILIPGAVRWLSGDVARQAADEEKKKEPTTAKVESKDEHRIQQGRTRSIRAGSGGPGQPRPGNAQGH
jgi:uncharacterized membrane protein